MDDLISRRAAIDALDYGNSWEHMGITLIDRDDAKRQIEHLPSAQPEFAEDTNVTTTELAKRTDETEQKVSKDDLISRKSVIEIASGFCHPANIARELAKLPSAQPEPQWIPCSEPPKKDGVYIVYAPDYSGGSSSAKECHDGVMFSKYKKGKWSIEHGYYDRPNCVKAWMPIEPWRGEQS